MFEGDLYVSVAGGAGRRYYAITLSERPLGSLSGPRQLQDDVGWQDDGNKMSRTGKKMPTSLQDRVPMPPFTPNDATWAQLELILATIGRSLRPRNAMRVEVV